MSDPGDAESGCRNYHCSPLPIYRTLPRFTARNQVKDASSTCGVASREISGLLWRRMATYPIIRQIRLPPFAPVSGVGPYVEGYHGVRPARARIVVRTPSSPTAIHQMGRPNQACRAPCVT